MHTAIYKLVESIIDDVEQFYASDPKIYHDSTVTRDAVLMVVNDAIPHFVISDKVTKLLTDKSVVKSFQAMIEAGVNQLPFDPILMEFMDLNEYGKRGRCFVRLQTAPLVKTQVDTENADIYAYPVLMMESEIDPERYYVAAIQPDTPICVEWGSAEEEVPFLVYSHHKHDDIAHELSMMTAMAMALGLLMLNTRGVHKEHVDTTRLNKARAKKGKRSPPGNGYTVIHVGTIYDRAGNAHSASGTGRHMPVHWRAGHVRKQRVGPRTVPRLERPEKIVFIAPILVNYDPDSEVPVPKKEVNL